MFSSSLQMILLEMCLSVIFFCVSLLVWFSTNMYMYMCMLCIFYKKSSRKCVCVCRGGISSPRVHGEGECPSPPNVTLRTPHAHSTRTHTQTVSSNQTHWLASLPDGLQAFLAHRLKLDWITPEYAIIRRRIFDAAGVACTPVCRDGLS